MVPRSRHFVNFHLAQCHSVTTVIGNCFNVIKAAQGNSCSKQTNQWNKQTQQRRQRKSLYKSVIIYEASNAM